AGDGPRRRAFWRGWSRHPRGRWVALVQQLRRPRGALAERGDDAIGRAPPRVLAAPLDRPDRANAAPRGRGRARLPADRPHARGRRPGRRAEAARGPPGGTL